MKKNGAAYSSIYSTQMRTPRRHGFLRSLFGLVVLGVAVMYGVAALTAPWSFHIGGRSTPLLFWSGAAHRQSML